VCITKYRITKYRITKYRITIMYKLFIGILIFCIILFIYLHIHFHLKTGDDLEVYEVDQLSKDKLEEICDLRQPVVFDFMEEGDDGCGDNTCRRLIEHTNKTYITKNYPAFEIKIRNVKEPDYESEIFIPLPLHAGEKLLVEDKKSTYFSENNGDFLQESGVVKQFQYNDMFIRPYMVSNCNYDIMMGSENTTTPFRYELNYRNYFLVTEGTVVVKMTPPKSAKYLYTVYDYENFEFRSPVNAWNPQPQYIADFDKIKCLDVSLTRGKIIQIPAYWWYSIKFSKDSCISCFRYRTYMNNIAITPHIVMYSLQQQNVKRNIVSVSSPASASSSSSSHTNPPTISIVSSDVEMETKPQHDVFEQTNNTTITTTTPTAL